MSGLILRDAFGHHVWATSTLIDACLELPPDRLETAVPGTYGSIIDTMRHLVGADSAYLYVIGGERTPRIDEDDMGLADLRAAVVANGDWWQTVLGWDLDATAELVRRRDDGTAGHAPLGIRLAQVLHHGTDHRSQICTAITSLGIEPPEIDVWSFGETDGRVFET